MGEQGDPDIFQENFNGVLIWWNRFDQEYFFEYEGEKYENVDVGALRAQITELIAESKRKEREEAEAIEEAMEEEILVLPEDMEIVGPPAPPEDRIIEPPRVLSLPALPWYAAWLQPILEYLGLLTESVVNFFAPIFAPLGQLAEGLDELPGNIVKGFVDQVGDLMKASRDKGASLSTETLAEALEGTPEWMKSLQSQLDIIIDPILAQYGEAIDPKSYEESAISGPRAVEALNEIRSKLVAAAIVQFSLHALVEAGSLGQFEFMKEIDTMIASKFGTDALIERSTMLPIEKAILIPAEQQLNSIYTPEIPTYTDLINMVVKEVIPLDRFKEEMAKLGFNGEWAQFIWDAHFRPPDWGQLLQAYYRGAISREELDTLKVLVDLDPRYDVVWDSLIEVIPPYSELVNQLVKEVIDLPEFTKNMKWYGFDEKWAQRIWDAHFTPPALGDLLTAWRRGEITNEELDELMILVDLDPRYKAIFDTRKYIDPTIRQGRYMYEAGAIDEERVTNIVERQGFFPDDVAPMTEYLVTFQERLFKTAYLRALATGTIYGAYTDEELVTAVTDAGYSEEVAEWMIKTAEVRKATTEARAGAPKPKLLSVGNLKKAYIEDFLTEDDLRRDLMLAGYEQGDIDIMIMLLDTDKVSVTAGGKKLALSQAELMNAFRYGEVTEDYTRTELLLRGLPLDEVDILIATKKKQWGLPE